MMGQPRATRNACQAEATRQKKQHSYLGWRGGGGGWWWWKGLGKGGGMGEGHTASCPDFANLEKHESEYSCQTAAIWRKLKYILLENKQKKRERERERARDVNFLYNRVKELSFIGLWSEEAIVAGGWREMNCQRRRTFG